MLTLGFLVKVGLLALMGFMAWLWLGTDGGFRPLAALSMTLGLGLDLAILAAYEANGLAERTAVQSPLRPRGYSATRLW